MQSTTACLLQFEIEHKLKHLLHAVNTSSMADTASWIAQGLNSIDDDDLFVDIKPKECVSASAVHAQHAPLASCIC